MAARERKKNKGSPLKLEDERTIRFDIKGIQMKHYNEGLLHSLIDLINANRMVLVNFIIDFRDELPSKSTEFFIKQFLIYCVAGLKEQTVLERKYESLYSYLSTKGIDSSLLPTSTAYPFHILKGHTDVIWDLKVTPNGRLLISACRDGSLKVWDVQTGLEMHTLIGHNSSVHKVALTSDSRLALSASSDKTLKLWDLKLGKAIHTLVGHTNEVHCLALTGDGNVAVSGGIDGNIKVWDPKKGIEMHTLTGHTSWINSVALTPDGKRAVSNSNDRTIRIWDLQTGKEIYTVKGQTRKFYELSISPNGKFAASNSNDNTLTVLDLCRNKELHSLIGHRGAITCFEFSRDSKTVVTGSKDKTLKMWNLQSGKEIRTLTGGNISQIRCLALTPDSRLAISGTGIGASVGGGVIKIWNLKSGKELHSFKGDRLWIDSLRTTEDGKYFISTSSATIRIWDLTNLSITIDNMIVLYSHMRESILSSIDREVQQLTEKLQVIEKVQEVPPIKEEMSDETIKRQQARLQILRHIGQNIYMES